MLLLLCCCSEALEITYQTLAVASKAADRSWRWLQLLCCLILVYLLYSFLNMILRFSWPLSSGLQISCKPTPEDLFSLNKNILGAGIWDRSAFSAWGGGQIIWMVRQWLTWGSPEWSPGVAKPPNSSILLVWNSSIIWAIFYSLEPVAASSCL